MLEVVKNFVLVNAKAVAGLLVGALVTFLASQGVDLDNDTQVALATAVSGVLTALVVWLVPNKGK